ncbi:patatin-like phospholipase family protein [Verticiella sediminum]|uniref:patatin-like phospholipase family protein n=1 Tax=Verticiella sediminum TaxID=1247510 RepID=UPI0031F0E533
MTRSAKLRSPYAIGDWRSRLIGVGVAVAVAAALFAGCGAFRNIILGDPPAPLSLDSVRSTTSHGTGTNASAPVVGLALGGGGLRGYAHIGVLQAFEEAGIDVEVIAGTSAGAVIGAAYASGRTVEEIKQLAENLDVSSLIDWRLSTTSFLRGDALARWASDMARNTPIEKMPRKFGAVAAVLDTGEAVLVERGDVGMAIRASAAIPGSMPPVESTRGPLVDGGISSLVPVRFARAMGADVVIGVDIYCNSPPRSGSTFLATLARVSRTQTCLLSSVEMAEADVLVAPTVGITDMRSAAQREASVLAGYRAAKAAMPAVLDQISGHATSTIWPLAP